jgi:hypothetical protein
MSVCFKAGRVEEEGGLMQEEGGRKREGMERRDGETEGGEVV